MKYRWRGQARVHRTALEALQRAGLLQGDALQAVGRVLVQALVTTEAWLPRCHTVSGRCRTVRVLADLMV